MHLKSAGVREVLNFKSTPKKMPGCVSGKHSIGSVLQCLFALLEKSLIKGVTVFQVDATKHTLAKYLMELTIVEYDMAHLPPSEIAAAALCLSMKLLGNLPWSATLEHYSKYTESDLLPVMKKMVKLVQKANTGKLTAVHTKYKSSKFMRISVIPELKSIGSILGDQEEEEEE